MGAHHPKTTLAGLWFAGQGAQPRIRSRWSAVMSRGMGWRLIAPASTEFVIVFPLNSGTPLAYSRRPLSNTPIQMTVHQEPPSRGSPRTSSLLRSFVASHTHERVSLRDLGELLETRAFGFLLLIFALPNTLPILGIPGLSTVTGIPLTIVALQMVLGLPKPMLPNWVAQRSMALSDFRRLVERVAPWLERLERLMKPRWLAFSGKAGERLFGVFCLLLAVVLTLPIPLGNLLPAVAIAFMALGMIERDGLLILFGSLIGGIGLVLISGVIWAMAKTALYFLHNILVT